jgi:hypothetical protein
MNPLPHAPGPGWPGWPFSGRDVEGADAADDDDTTSTCSSDLDSSDFTRYNHSHRKHLVDALPLRLSHDWGHVAHDIEPAIPFAVPAPLVRPVPDRPPRVNLAASSFRLPPDDDLKRPTLRQWHDEKTPRPRHGANPDCRRPFGLPEMYDTDLTPGSLVDHTLDKCRALYMIDYGLAGGIGDGVDLPRRERLRFVVAPRNEEAEDYRGHIGPQTSLGEWWHSDHYEFRGFVDELDSKVPEEKPKEEPEGDERTKEDREESGEHGSSFGIVAGLD